MKHVKAGRPLRLLIVDDEPIIREVMREVMEDLGVEVVGEAANGIEAVELAEKLLPDVILIDLRMPLLDGIEATRRIKRSTPRVRVIALSAYDDASLKASAAEAGADSYLVKGSAASMIEDAVLSGWSEELEPVEDDARA